MTDPKNHNGVGSAGVSSPPTDAEVERQLVRAENGLLVDALTYRPVSLAELADDVRSGLRFRARDSSGGECTYQVLVQALLATLVPGPTAGAAELLSAAVRDGLPTGRTT
ncbi:MULTISPECIES: hypothetical protein [unclassified Kitasatospora]|uniref:hypothetical protein n=1 Tax=unclassified Kitasatospora TaxID=2633591 RepID=UPI0037F1F0A3